MGIIRVQHSFQGISGQAEDRYVNVFYFQPDVAPGTLATLATAIKQYWVATPAGATYPLSHFMGGIADTAGASIKMYDLDDALPRAPIYTETYTPGAFGSGSSKNLPAEIALCLSYSAGPSSGLPIARRRGRMYIGPFCDFALGTGAISVDSRPNDDLKMSIVESATELAATADGAGYDWSVFSPTNNEAVSILTCWCNDAWDVQRRRGAQPTSRYSADIVP
jgi:hypothetical protein